MPVAKSHSKDRIGKSRPTADDFAGPVPECALHEVLNPSFITELDPGGAYEPYPALGKYTGWLLRRIGRPRCRFRDP
jgi:hypothetical protein